MKPFNYLNIILLCVLLFACDSSSASNTQDEATQALAPDQRIVAIGDLHGDLAATRAALRLAGAIDSQDRWIGGSLIVVQTGDQLDRGDGELQILQLLERLQDEAEKQGGRLYVLNGNHEIMNVQGDLRYVTQAGFQEFKSLPSLPLERPELKQVPEFARARAAAFLPGEIYAQKLAQRPTVLQLGGNVFAHGGILPAHAEMGIEKINRAYSQWLSGQTAELPALLKNDDSPIWTRAYSLRDRPADCEQLRQSLDRLKAQRMVVSHTVHPEINSACNGQVWRIDVGLSRYYGGSVQVLEIQDQQVRVLRAP